MLKRLLLFILIYLFSNIYLFSQGIKGRVTDEAGKPIEGASVYLHENRTGLITNENGEFNLTLAAGVYHIDVSCVGYEKHTEEILLNTKNINLDIILKISELQLKEVLAHSGEDPAYAIMRHAIAKAPYYQNVVKIMRYNAYSKGSGQLLSVPKIFGTMMSQGEKKEMEIMQNKTFLLESFSEITFTAPTKYEQNIKAFASSFPMMDDPENAMLSPVFSLYNPEFMTAVSPLNKNAFDYYRFRYEGFDYQEGTAINKISVIPKLKDGRLLEGTIYIADNDWDVRGATLKISIMGMNFTYDLHYHQADKDVFLVTDAQIDIAANILGAKFEATLLSSIQFVDIQLNDSLIQAQKASEITTKKAIKKQTKKSLEIKTDNRFAQSVDSLATRRDSAYWNSVRSIVLTEEEAQSYARRDTLEHFIDSVDNAERNPKFRPLNLLTGGRAGNDSSLLYFSYGGLLGALGGYNFVDGFQLGQNFSFDFKRKKNHHLIISPSIYYATARKTLLWTTESRLTYFPRSVRGEARLAFGRRSGNYNGENGMENLLSSAYAFFTGKNYAKFYTQKFVTLQNAMDIANGLRLSVAARTERRYAETNHTIFHLFNKKYSPAPNQPKFAENINANFTDLAAFSLSLTYTPEYYYIKTEKEKRYVRSRFPHFTLKYYSGIALSEKFASPTLASRFNRIEAGVQQNIKTSIFSNIHYQVNAGKYLNNNDFSYIDYKHFVTGGGAIFSLKSLQDAFVLLPHEQFSSRKWWVQAFLNYNSDYILLKRLPFLQGKIFGEGLHAKLLHTPAKPLYSEWGYSVGLGKVANASVFVAFDKIKFNAIGFQLAVPLFNLLKTTARTGTVTLSTGGVDVDFDGR